MAYAADLVAWSPGAPARQEPSARARADRDTTREIAFILSGTRPLAGTHAADYLAARNVRWLPIATPFSIPARLRHLDHEDAYGLRVVVRDMQNMPRNVDFPRAALARQGAGENPHLLRQGPSPQPPRLRSRLAGSLCARHVQ